MDFSTLCFYFAISCFCWIWYCIVGVFKTLANCMHFKNGSCKSGITTLFISSFHLKLCYDVFYRWEFSLASNDIKWQCLFPQYLLPLIETPLFVVNSAYDPLQVNIIFSYFYRHFHCYYRHGNWQSSYIQNNTLIFRRSSHLCLNIFI